MTSASLFSCLMQQHLGSSVSILGFAGVYKISAGILQYFFLFFLSSAMSPGPAALLNSHISWEESKALLRCISFLIDLNKFLDVRCDKLNQVVSSLIFGGDHEIRIS